MYLVFSKTVDMIYIFTVILPNDVIALIVMFTRCFLYYYYLIDPVVSWILKYFDILMMHENDFTTEYLRVIK